jgi:hypothetical protein
VPAEAALVPGLLVLAIVWIVIAFVRVQSPDTQDKESSRSPQTPLGAAQSIAAEQRGTETEKLSGAILKEAPTRSTRSLENVMNGIHG